MNSAVQPYLEYLTPEEIEGCKMVGLWNTLQKHDPAKSKFTSYLVNSIKWECLSQPRQIANSGNFEPMYVNSNFDEMIEDLVPELQVIMRQRFIENHTLRDIAEKHGCSHETIRKKLKLAVDQIRGTFK